MHLCMAINSCIQANWCIISGSVFTLPESIYSLSILQKKLNISFSSGAQTDSAMKMQKVEGQEAGSGKPGYSCP